MSAIQFQNVVKRYGAVGADQAEHLALLDAERHASQGVDLAVSLDDVFKLNCGLHVTVDCELCDWPLNCRLLTADC